MERLRQLLRGRDDRAHDACLRVGELVERARDVRERRESVALREEPERVLRDGPEREPRRDLREDGLAGALRHERVVEHGAELVAGRVHLARAAHLGGERGEVALLVAELEQRLGVAGGDGF